MRRRVRAWLAEAYRYLTPPADQSDTIRALTGRLSALEDRNSNLRSANLEQQSELLEAQMMSGPGPWRSEAVLVESEGGKLGIRESGVPLSQGAYGDLELALQNVDWRREVNISWLEFSRWGIEQIIRISRLYYIKNPVIRRLIDVCAIYVFGRGYEVSSPDKVTNDAIKEFLEDNKKVLGQVGLTDLERRKAYDGNLFFCFFPDKADTGKCKVRTLDPLEVLEIVTDPEDTDTPWYYRRCWSEKVLNVNAASPSAAVSTIVRNAWYPAIDYEPADRPGAIAGYPVMWDNPIYHRKIGTVSKWLYGCPPIYPALDWAKDARKQLEAISSFKQTLSQIAIQWKTKGGQQALQGVKGQMQTTVGPSAPIWDSNPTAVAGSTVVTGTGTDISALWQRGASADPEEVRRYLLMCCMCVGVPETFLADVSTGNLATATTLDRPTELAFLEKQEAWREDIIAVVSYALRISARAPSGVLREAHGPKVRIVEAQRVALPNGRMVYAEAEAESGTVEIKCTFPSVREGDIPALVGAIVQAMTLGNRGGQVVGIDAKEGVIKLAEMLDIPDPDEMAEAMYPASKYDPDRSDQELIMPIGKAQPSPGGEPQVQKNGETLPANDQKTKT